MPFLFKLGLAYAATVSPSHGPDADRRLEREASLLRVKLNKSAPKLRLST
jgi:hypothetical protein